MTPPRDDARKLSVEKSDENVKRRASPLPRVDVH